MPISAPGIGSGLDVNDIVAKLMAIERRPQQRLISQQTLINNQISALGRISSVLDTFKSAAAALSRPENLSSFVGELSDPSVARVTGSNNAVAGNHSLRVTQLATQHRMVTATDFDPSQGGSLTIQIGNRAADAVTINLEQGATLTDLRNAVNNADAGVTASIINDGTSDRLVITSNESGAANQITLTGSLSANSSFATTVAAQNAELEIDGISVTSASNTITAISGMTLELTGTTGSNPVSLRVTNDMAPLRERMEAFVAAYNNIRSTLNDLSRFDASGSNSGILSGDSTVRMVLDRVRGVLTSSQSGVSENFRDLASLGIMSNRDGTLRFDEDTFNAAAGSDFSGMAQTLSTYAAAFDRVVTNLTASDGVVASRTNALNTSHRSIGDRVENMNRLLSQTEARFRAQFGALDALMANIQTTSNFLSQQLSSLQQTRS